MPDAITPYNFVPLSKRTLGAEPEACEPSFDRYCANRHTGWLQIRCTALTPLYTRGVVQSNPTRNPIASAEDGEQKQVADFFHRGEVDGAKHCKPVLPGSSLRGMVRSVFEIFTESRIEFINDYRLFYRSFAGLPADLREQYSRNFQANARLIAGVLHKKRERDGKEAWVLHVCDEPQTEISGSGIKRRGFVAVSANDPLLDGRPRYKCFEANIQLERQGFLLQGTNRFELKTASLQPPGATQPGCHKGWLIFPGRDVQSRRYFQVILCPNSGATPPRTYDVPRTVYEDYLNWGQMAHGRKFQQNGEGTPRLLIEGEPTFALVDTQDPSKVSVIGANMMMALRYQFSLPTVAVRSCIAPLAADVPDMTQALFGTVPRQSEKVRSVPTIKSRIYFEDAECQSPTWYLDDADPVRIPSVLITPKPTALQTYLQQPLAGSNRLAHWNDERAQLRGHKRYWHRSDEAARRELDRRPPKKGLQPTRTVICPVQATTSFVGRIRFENLTDRELGALYASVQLPWDEEAGNCLAHKFGMGKSIGLGSLRVEVLDTVLFDMAARYQTVIRKEGDVSGRVSRAQTQNRLEAAYTVFVRALHGPNARTLWQSERQAAFANLLSWKPQLPPEQSRYVGINSDPLSEQWKNRRVLPLAADLETFTDVNWPNDVLRVHQAAREV